MNIIMRYVRSHGESGAMQHFAKFADKSDLAAGRSKVGGTGSIDCCRLRFSEGFVL